MSSIDRMHRISGVRALDAASVELVWSDGAKVEIDLGEWIKSPALDALRDPAQFAQVEVGDWGHGLRWPSGAELGADALWLETLSARGRADTRAFLEWRLRHGLSLSKAAEALGVSRRMVAYYSNGEKTVPRPILLACRGWEASHAA